MSEPEIPIINPNGWEAFCNLVAQLIRQLIEDNRPESPSQQPDELTDDRGDLFSVLFEQIFEKVRDSQQAKALFNGPLDEFNLAVATTIAILFFGKKAPIPPNSLFHGIYKLWGQAEMRRKERLASDPSPKESKVSNMFSNPICRVPEFVLYYLLRFRDRPPAWGTAIPAAFTDSAWQWFLDYIDISIRAALTELRRAMGPVLPSDLSNDGWSQQIAARYTGWTFASRCHCCLDTFDDASFEIHTVTASQADVREEDVAVLVATDSNKLKKIERCLTHHHISGWAMQSSEIVFFHHIQRAVKGIPGAY